MQNEKYKAVRLSAKDVEEIDKAMDILKGWTCLLAILTFLLGLIIGIWLMTL